MNMKKNEKLLSDIQRLVGEVVSLRELRNLLNTKEKITIKYGVDCTAPFLHLGHAVNLWVMRRFQEDGHKVIFLIGDFTSRIGDPTGKSNTRKIMTSEEINNFANEFIQQVKKILITDDENLFEIRRNSEWYSNMSLDKFINLMSMVTHSKLISRDMFKTRIENSSDIYMNEMIYPVLQGYDSVMLDSDLTIVGSDQLYNEMMGRFYQEKFKQNKQVIITTKITKGLWGEEKQSKSIGNYVAITDTSKEMFYKIMQLSDERIIDWLKVYSDISLKEIEEIEKKLALNKMENIEAKYVLAHSIVSKYYDSDIANKEKIYFVNTYSKKVFPEDAKEVQVELSDGILEILSKCLKNEPKRELKRLIMQNAVTLNGKKINDIKMHLELNEVNYLKIGKRKFFKVRVKK